MHERSVALLIALALALAGCAAEGASSETLPTPYRPPAEESGEIAAHEPMSAEMAAQIYDRLITRSATEPTNPSEAEAHYLANAPAGEPVAFAEARAHFTAVVAERNAAIDQTFAQPRHDAELVRSAFGTLIRIEQDYRRRLLEVVFPHAVRVQLVETYYQSFELERHLRLLMWSRSEAWAGLRDVLRLIGTDYRRAQADLLAALD